MRGVSRLFEGTEGANAAAGIKGDTLEEQAWWPFSASLGCSRFLGDADPNAHRSYISSLDKGAEVAAAADALRPNQDKAHMHTHGRSGGRTSRRPIDD